ncbi:MAG TPA: ATP-binding protein, partial [Gemmatimonadales bacterium]|nr:ATP-binding protein [Gemmatimonadales bacterium]
LRTELAPELDEAAAAIDRDGARQVLLNLLDNAVKYAPAAGDVLVRAGVAGGRLELAVDDAGPGIPPAERDRVWEPFYRLDRDRRGAAEGSGIGLAVVRRLAEAHGGSARIESSRRGGTRVIVTLGAVRPAAVPAREPAFAGAGAGAGTGAVAT